MCVLIIIIDGSVINSFGIECYSNCDSDMLDTTNSVDTSPNDFNGCCNSVSTTSGYGSTSINCDAACKLCYNHYISLHIPATYLYD